MIKKIRRALLRKNNGGFTLVEVIVSSALLAVLLVGMMAFITPALNMMHTEEADSRAKTVAETIEAYINGSIRNSVYVAMFENVSMSTDINDINGAIYKNVSLNKMKDFCQKPGNIAVYDLKCLAIRRIYDVKRQEYKYVVTSETPLNNSVQLDTSKSYSVFENCFYDGFFPQITLTALNNQIEGEPALDPADVKNIPAFETKVNIYTDQNMTDPNLVLSGKGYINFINMRSNILNSGDYKIFPASDTFVRSADDAETAFGYPGDTYIYYVTRRATYNAAP